MFQQPQAPSTWLLHRPLYSSSASFHPDWAPCSYDSLCILAPPPASGSCSSSPRVVPPQLLGWRQPWPSPWQELIPTTQTCLVEKLAAHRVGWCGVNPHIQGICCRSGYKMQTTCIVCRNGHSLTNLSCQIVCSKSRCLGCSVPGNPRLRLDGWNSFWMSCTALKG